jgi:hypothetical protein
MSLSLSLVIVTSPLVVDQQVKNEVRFTLDAIGRHD